MQAVRKTIAKARRRSFYQLWVMYLGKAVAGSLVIALVLLLASRLLALPINIATYFAASIVLLSAASVMAIIKRDSREQIAREIDSRLNLQDRFASAMYAEQLADDAFAKQVIADTEKQAKKIDVRYAFPIRPTGIWNLVIVLAAVLGMGIVFLPDDIDLLGRLAANDKQQAKELRAEQTQKQIDQAVKVIAAAPDEQQQAKSLEQAIDELKELSAKDLQDPTKRKQAAARVSEVRDQLAKASQEKKQTLQSLRNRLSQLDREVKGPADDFSDALRRGQFDDAGEMIREVTRKVEQMSPAQRDALKQQLENLAKQLVEQQQVREKQAEQQEKQKPPDENEAADKSESAMQDKAVEEDKQQSTAEKWMKRFADTVKEMNEAAKQQPQDKQQSKQPKPQQNDNQNQQQQPKQQPKQQPGQSEPQQNDKQQQQQQPGQPESQQNDKQNEQQSGQKQSQPGQQSQQQQSQDPRQQTGEQSKQQQSGKQQSDSQSGKEQPSQQSQPAPGQQQPGQQMQPADQSDQPGQQPVVKEQPGDQPGKPTPKPGESDLPDKFTPEQIEQIKELAEQMNEQLSEMSELEKQTEQLTENDQQLEQLMRSLSESLADKSPPENAAKNSAAGSSDGGDPTGQGKRMSDYDKTISRELQDAQGRPVSSWLSDKPIETGESNATYQQSVRQARDEAERAISDDQLPQKYHPAVRQYFEQLPETAEQTSDQETKQ